MQKLYIILLNMVLFLSLDAFDAGNIIYHANKGNIDYALQQYIDLSNLNDEHDIELIHQLAFTLLDIGYKCPDNESNQLALFGASISVDEKVQYILEDGLQKEDLTFQLIALNFLAKMQNENTKKAFETAIKSPFLPIRLEALFYMAEQKYPQATTHISSLLQKLPPELHPIFPKLYALSGDTAAIKILQRFLSDSDEHIRINATEAALEYGRDDLLPDIRRNASHINVSEKEISLLALGILGDHSSINLLQKERSSKIPNVKLAALKALWLLGVEDVIEDIKALALQEDIFAITTLGGIQGTQDVLKDLLENKNFQIRLNAAMALLELNDPACLKIILEVLIADERGLSPTRISSHGGGLTAWKAISSFSQKMQGNPMAFEMHLNTLENIIVKAENLPDSDFLKLAHILFENEQKNLVPLLIQLLEKMQTAEATDLLKYHSEKIGSPFIRNWCNLALFRLKEDGNYLSRLKTWILSHKYHPLIKFRPLIPWDKRGFEDCSAYRYQLTPQETSRLLIEVLEALVDSKDNESIKILMQTIKEGNRKNRYTIAGLLLRL